MKEKLKVAFQGEKGAYSHLACQEIFPNVDAVACTTFEEAFQFKTRDDFNKFVYDLRAGNYGKANLIYNEDFQEKVKNVCSSFRFKHALMDQHK